MPRTLILSNGSLFIGFDNRGNARDLFFPHVGLYNHVGGYKIRLGVWTEGHFGWTDEGDWSCEQSYIEGEAVALQVLRSRQFEIEISIKEAVSSNERTVWQRDFVVRNIAERDREIRLYTTHDLRIEESDIGDCALWDPDTQSLIHYKGPNWFYFHWDETFEYTTGIKAFGNLEGSWRDAEDGHLSFVPIAQGSVDSTMSRKFDSLRGGELTCSWRMAVLNCYDSKRATELLAMQIEDQKLDEVPSELRTVLSNNCADLFQRSVFALRAHCDARGAVIASCDSDIMATNRANYCYFWPRDGAHVGDALLRVRSLSEVRSMLVFCDTILRNQFPYFLQKYRADESFGASWHPWVVNGQKALPVQLDESALILVTAIKFLELSEAESYLDVCPFIVPMADFLIDYRDKVTGLPGPSWDLWEERRGFHTVTAASVAAGLDAVAEFLNRVDATGQKYADAAKEIRDAIRKYCFDPEAGVFSRGILAPPSGNKLDRTVDASLLLLAILGGVSADDTMFIETEKLIIEKLTIQSQVGGLARYEGDYYFRGSEHYPGNPWIITTLWLARVRARRSKTTNELSEVLEALQWCVRHSSPAGLLGEQMHPETGALLSVSPLAWSHAEYIQAAMDYVEAIARVKE